MYYIYGVSVPSLLIESTDSMIKMNFKIGSDYDAITHVYIIIMKGSEAKWANPQLNVHMGNCLKSSKMD